MNNSVKYDKEEIKKIFKARAQSFTPEWNMDTDNPDIAAALAMVYADMVEGTMKKINNLPLKNIIAFHNTFNASLLPASPSQGYVSFSLSASDIGSTEVQKGTVMIAYSEDGTPVRYETCDDVLVSPCNVVKAFCADDNADKICEYTEIESSRTELFDMSGKNLQSHVLRIAHPYAFNIRSHGTIMLEFCHTGGLRVRADHIQALTDKNTAVIEYFDDEGNAKPFSDVYEKNGKLYLILNNSDSGMNHDSDGFDIRMTVKDISRFEGFYFSYVAAYPSGELIEPDCITDGNLDLERTVFFPFGERFQLFNEIYIGCGEVLDKRGAEVTVSFDLSLLEVPIENQLLDDGIKWKWIAKKSDFEKMPSYKISITKVIWEYYNGSGWSRLFPDSSYSEIFNYRQGAEHSFQSMTFKCPDDISEFFVGSKSSYYIRARVLGAENLYKLKGVYMSPCIRNMSFSYSYRENGCRIHEMESHNNLETMQFRDFELNGEKFKPFIKTGSANRNIYFGLSDPPDKGPLRIYWDIQKKPISHKAELIWEYYSSKGWQNMNIADETGGFTKPGLTIFLDNHDPVKKKLFNQELYWIRISDVENAFVGSSVPYPVSMGMYYNSVRAVNVDSRNEEVFSVNVYLENTEIELSSGNIMDLDLYVNEYSNISEAEVLAFEKENRIIKKTDSAGIVTQIWVKWNETNGFITEDNNSRCYVLDRSRGVVIFGNGRKGRIPSVSEPDNIRVVYTTGGGKRSNALPGRVSTMERYIGFVSSVTNPKSFYGGCDEETLNEGIKRCRVMLRTQGKVITKRDLEELALYSSRCVKKAKCFVGRDVYGEHRRGVVTLVIMKQENSEFARVQQEVRNNLLPVLPLSLTSSGTLNIIEPINIILNVRVELRVNSLDGIFSLKRKVEKCISRCIEFYSEGKKDSEWKLGRIPNEHQIRSAVSKLEEVEHIKKIHVNTYVTGNGGLNEIDEDDIRRLYYVLPKSGTHDIIVTLT